MAGDPKELINAPNLNGRPITVTVIGGPDMSDHPIALWFGNIASAGAILTTLAGLLPPITAIVALIYYFIQISESETVKSWRRHRRAHRIAKLRARLLELEAMNVLEPERPED